MTHMRRSFFADAADVQRICPYFPSRKGAKGLKRAFFRENGHFAAFPDCVAEGGGCVAGLKHRVSFLKHGTAYCNLCDVNATAMTTNLRKDAVSFSQSKS